MRTRKAVPSSAPLCSLSLDPSRGRGLWQDRRGWVPQWIKTKTGEQPQGLGMGPAAMKPGVNVACPTLAQHQVP